MGPSQLSLEECVVKKGERINSLFEVTTYLLSLFNTGTMGDAQSETQQVPEFLQKQGGQFFSQPVPGRHREWIEPIMIVAW